MKSVKIIFTFLVLALGAATFCHAQTTMEWMVRNKAAVQKAYDYINARNFDAFAQLLTEDHVDHAMPPGQGNSRQKVLEGIKQFISAFPDFKIETKQIIAEGNTVMGWVEITGTFKGELMGMKPTGKSFKITDVDIIKFNDKGLATDHWAVQDMCAIFSQVGAAMPEGK